MVLQADAAIIATIRRFNRFYTQRIGVLTDHLHHSEFSLSEARLIYELAQRAEVTASQLGAELMLDTGYLSRLLSKLEKQGVLAREPSPSDGRQNLLRLTSAGQQAFTKLNAGSAAEIGALIQPLSGAEQERLVRSMHTIEQLLGAEQPQPAGYLLRQHRPGDLGWIVQRHAQIYTQEYGWNASFEGLVASIAAQFIQHYDAAYERCWIAELDGEPIGSVMVVKQSAEVAKLRLLLVEARARGLGVGRRLVQECIHFARQAGYQKLILWTNDVLVAARRIYADAGFQLVATEPHSDFGPTMVGETWELTLR